MLVGLLITISAARGAPVVVDAEPGLVVAAVQTRDGRTWSVLDVGPDDGLRVPCGPDTRRAVVVAGAGGLALVEEETPGEPRGARVAFGPPMVRGTWQAVDCVVSRAHALGARTPIAWIDAVERRAKDHDGLAAALAEVGIDAGDAQAWAATRPSGGAVPVLGGPRWPQARPAQDPAGVFGRGAVVGPDLPVQVRGPARVTLRARVDGPATPCLHIDGAATCQEALAAPSLDARARWSAVVTWSVWLPPGKHELVLDTPAWASLRQGDGAWWRPPGGRPAEVVVIAGAHDDPLGGVDAPGPRGAMLLPSARPWAAGEAGWAALAEVQTPWEADEARLWWGPGGPCTLVVGGEERWTAGAGRSPARFIDVRGEAPALSTEGCAAWAHQPGPPAPGAARWVATPTRPAVAGEAVVLTPMGAADRVRAWLPEVGPTRVAVGGLRVTVHPLRLSAAIGEDGTLGGVVVTLPLPAADAVAAAADRPVSWLLTPSAVVAGLTTPTHGEPPDAGSQVPQGPPHGEPPDVGSQVVQAPPHGEPPDVGSQVPQAPPHGEPPDVGSQVPATAPDGDPAVASLDARIRHLVEVGEVAAAVALARGAARDDVADALAAALTAARERADGLAWRVVPTELSFVPGAVATPEVVAAAARGDHLTVARALGDAPAALPWWRAAATEQILTADDALVGWRAATRAGSVSSAAVIGRWSRWSSVSGLLGARPVRAAWPRKPDRDVRFPDDWPAEEAQAVGAGWRVRVDGRDAILARCARLDPAAACTLRQVGLDGRPLGQWTLPGDGAATSVALAPAPGFLDGPEDGAVVQVRLRVDPVREAFEASGSTTLSARGPASLRWELFDPAGRVQGALVATCDGVERRWAAEPVTVTLLPPGACVVRLDVRRGTLVRVAAREARPARAAPPELSEVAAPPAIPTHAPVAAAPAPRVDPPLVVRLDVGATSQVAGVDDAPGAGSWAGRAGARLDARRGDLWGQVGVTAWIPDAGDPAGGLSLGGELRGGPSGPWRWWGAVDGELRADASVRALRGGATAGLSVSWRSLLEARLTARVDAAARVGDPGPGTVAAVWSTWREQHRLIGHFAARLRARPTRWFQVTLGGELRTNGPNDIKALDAAAGHLSAWLAHPLVRAELAIGVQHRTPDTWRFEPWTSPELLADVDGVVWHSDRTRLLVGAGVGWLPTLGRVAVQAGLGVAWAGRPGLNDQRPSDNDARFALGWLAP